MLKKYFFYSVILFFSFSQSTIAASNIAISPNKTQQIFTHQLNEYCKQGSDGLALFIDSLLDLTDFDTKWLAAIQHKIDSLNGLNPLFNEEFPFPAHHFYLSWNTLLSHPYSRDLITEDTLINLCLNDTLWECAYHPPFESKVISKFGPRGNRMHNGVDLKLQVGDSVRSAFKGVVRLAKWQNGYGKTIIIRHHNGLETIYAHLSTIFLESGDFVEPGMVIGLGGNTGRSTGSHLHFETRFKGIAINPEIFIDFDTHQLKNSQLILKKTSTGYFAYTPSQYFHHVQKGDYLYKIAQQHNITVNELCELNNIPRNYILSVGEKIRVF